MEPEVRYHMLRPKQVVARRQACPVAYIPIGTLEWHGLHNPLGADTLQAEGLAIMCAQKGGGLAFPPLYYGDTRADELMEVVAEDRDAIAERMGLPLDSFSPDRQPFTAEEQVRNYRTLLIQILAEVESMGFAVGVLVAGHYPLIGHARAAARWFNEERDGPADGMLAWACVDYQLVQDQYSPAGDHAAGWETSHLLALCPDTVDLSTLPAEGEDLIGVRGAQARPPQDATAAFGRETLEAAALVILEEVTHRLNHRPMYLGRGNSLHEGLWR